MRAIVVSMSKTPHGPVVYNQVGYDTPFGVSYMKKNVVSCFTVCHTVYILCSLMVRFSTMLSQSLHNALTDDRIGAALRALFLGESGKDEASSGLEGCSGHNPIGLGK